MMDFVMGDCSRLAFQLRGGYLNSIRGELPHRYEFMHRHRCVNVFNWLYTRCVESTSMWIGLTEI